MQGVIRVAVLALGSAVALADIESSFDASAEGWTAVSDNFVDQVPQFFPSGGDPGGYIEQPDFGTGSWFFVAPSGYHGDLSAYDGGRLAMSLRAQGVTNPAVEIDDIIIEGAAGTLTFDIASDNNPTNAWRRFSVRIDATEAWLYAGAHGGLSLAEQIALVLEDVTAIRIRGDWGDGPDIGHLDSVLLTRGPCHAADLAEPYWLLDFFDVQRFLNYYNDRHPGADVNGDGLWDFYDLSRFLNLYSGGCP